MNNTNPNAHNEDIHLARLRPSGSSFGSTNGGWCYDAYPNLKPLDAGARICIADIEGPAVITHIHSTRQFSKNESCDRGVLLEIEFDDASQPSVRVPLADFFADGTGQSMEFTSLYIEKAPKSYNLFIPMPFARRARVWLHNQTPKNFSNYSFVEYQRLPAWDPSLGYFHATWKRFSFPLHGTTDQPFFHVEGRGHLLGTSWTVTTDEPFFNNMHWVMEGNVEMRVDTQEPAVADYLGSEDSFGFSWGFQNTFAGLRNGLTYISGKAPAQVTAYRFRDRNVIPFQRFLDVRIDWSTDWCNNEKFQKKMKAIHEQGGGLVDYATTWYWYQDRPGFDHGPLMPYEQRIRRVLAPNPYHLPTPTVVTMPRLPAGSQLDSGLDLRIEDSGTPILVGRAAVVGENLALDLTVSDATMRVDRDSPWLGASVEIFAGSGGLGLGAEPNQLILIPADAQGPAEVRPCTGSPVPVSGWWIETVPGGWRARVQVPLSAMGIDAAAALFRFDIICNATSPVAGEKFVRVARWGSPSNYSDILGLALVVLH